MINLTMSKLIDIATYVPEKILANNELAMLYPDWTAEKIYQKTGIRERHIADLDQTAGDLAFEAANRLFSNGEVKAEDVDFVILCTQAPDYILPTTACILQHRLGISKKAGALDINLGCSGFVYGLSLAKGLVESGSASCVLLLTADTYSKYIHPLDKSVRTLFGDGATATAICSCSEKESMIGPFVFGTDGAGAENLIVEAGLFRVPNSSETSEETTDDSGNTRTRQHLYMNGAAVMSFSLQEVPRAMEALLKKSGLSQDNVDFFILHQANKFMLEALRKKMKVPHEKLPILMENVGNTVSSSIPMALSELKKDGLLSPGQRLMLIGFGVGYSWAACLINL